MENKYPEVEYIEIDSVEYYKRKLRNWSAVAFFALCLVPLIIYDSMGYADYFKLNSGVALDDNKLFRFAFGWIYFMKRLPIRGFIPFDLFQGLARLTLGTESSSVFSAVLSVMYIAASALLYLGSALCFISINLSLRIKNNRNLDKGIARAGMRIFLYTSCMFFLVILTLVIRVASPEFKLDDFLAYGAVKHIIAFLLSVLLGLLSRKLYTEILR